MDDPGFTIDYIGGNCPVQADVEVYARGEADRYGYFRARGSGWSFEIYPPGITRAASGELPDVSPEWEIDASCRRAGDRAPSHKKGFGIVWTHSLFRVVL